MIDYYRNRHLCDVLEEMRTCFKTRNFSYLEGLIEEVQVSGNKMESALNTKKDYETLYQEVKELNKKKQKLKQEVKELESEKIKEN